MKAAHLAVAAAATTCSRAQGPLNELPLLAGGSYSHIESLIIRFYVYDASAHEHALFYHLHSPSNERYRFHFIWSFQRDGRLSSVIFFPHSKSINPIGPKSFLRDGGRAAVVNLTSGASLPHIARSTHFPAPQMPTPFLLAHLVHIHT